jgi:hypothetical protein
LADQKISELTALTGANVADDDAIAIVDTSATETKKIVFSELKNALDTATGFVRITGDTMTGNLSMGDNVKAIFGAGSDLQIYHDGAKSLIVDQGTGPLQLRATDFEIKNSGNTAIMAGFVDGGEVSLRYNNSPKLATTNTGVDITGTLTSDVIQSSSTGSASAPAYSFDGHTTAGFYRPSGLGSSIGVATSGVQRALFANNGDLSLYEDTGTTAKFFWDASAESLGLGATSFAGETLRMERSGDMIVGLFSGASNGTYLNMGTTSNRDIGQISYTQSTNHMSFRTNDAERMRIDSSGNVGIGTDSPTFTSAYGGLHVHSTYPEIHLTGTDSGSGASDGFKIQKNSANHVYLWNYENAFMAFGTNNTEAMRIDSSGNLLVGTPSPTSNAITTIRTPGTSGAFIPLCCEVGITSNGFVAISFVNPAGQQGTIAINTSSTSYNTTSDYRLKENVVELTGATTRLKQLEPKRFNFIADADTTVDGFLAHEVQSIVPEAITGTHNEVDADGNPVYQGIDQSKLVPLLVATIKELEARITALENA